MDTQEGFFCQKCGTVYIPGIMACKVCDPELYAKYFGPLASPIPPDLADTASLAICLAALKAVSDKPDLTIQENRAHCRVSWRKRHAE